MAETRASHYDFVFRRGVEQRTVCVWMNAIQHPTADKIAVNVVTVAANAFGRDCWWSELNLVEARPFHGG